MQCCINFAYVFWMAIQSFRCHDNFFHLCLDKGDIIKHTATAIQKSSSKQYMSKKTADKGKTAKAETGYHKNFTEWNSYYNHV